MKVKEIMTKNPIVLPIEATLKQVADQMEKRDFGFMPIVEDGIPRGVITDRDITIRSVAKGESPESTECSKIMSKSVYSCKEEDDLKQAIKDMSNKQIHRLLVLDNSDKICGVISLGDIARKSDDPDLCAQALKEISKK